MSNGSDKRRAMRLKIHNGSVVLVHPAMPNLRCALLDLSPGGARCRADYDLVPDEFVLASWRRALGSEGNLQIDLPVPNQRQSLRLDASVRHLRVDLDGGIAFGLQFAGMDRNKIDCIERLARALSRPGGPPGNTQFMPKVAESPEAQQAATAPSGRRGLASMGRTILQTILGSVPATSGFRKMRLGEILQRMGRLSAQQAVDAYDRSREAKIKYGRYLMDAKLITASELCRALSLQSGLPVVDLTGVKPPAAALRMVPPALMRQHSCVPFNIQDRVIFVALAYPLPPAAIQQLEQKSLHKIKAFLTQEDTLLPLLQRVCAEVETSDFALNSP